MRLARVEVHEERSVGLQDPSRLDEPGLEVRGEVVEAVRERRDADHFALVAPAREAGAVAVGVVAARAQARATLRAAGVERRVDVDQVDERVRQRAQNVEVLALYDPVPEAILRAVAIRALSLDLFDTLVDLHMDRLPIVEIGGRRTPSTYGLLHGASVQWHGLDFERFAAELGAVDRQIRDHYYAEHRELPTIERFSAFADRVGVTDPALAETAHARAHGRDSRVRDASSAPRGALRSTASRASRSRSARTSATARPRARFSNARACSSTSTRS